jgi:hypothetical protein
MHCKKIEGREAKQGEGQDVGENKHRALTLVRRLRPAKVICRRAMWRRPGEQLMEIADRCGGPCDDYKLLVKAIVEHVTAKRMWSGRC